jgi:hypothetical protein
MAHGKFRLLLLGAFFIGSLLACTGGSREWVLPDPSVAAAWYGEGTEARIDGNVLEIRGTMDADHLRRGGRIWARSGPFFYLFNVHVQALLRDYPDLAAVRVQTFTPEGEPVAEAMITRDALNEYRWREALARASQAQQEGTTNPRVVERLIQFGEDHSRFRYHARAE